MFPLLPIFEKNYGLKLIIPIVIKDTNNNFEYHNEEFVEIIDVVLSPNKLRVAFTVFMPEISILKVTYGTDFKWDIEHALHNKFSKILTTYLGNPKVVVTVKELTL